MPKKYSGNSKDMTSPILGAKFWKKGTKIEGNVRRIFETTNGDCCEIQLKKPVNVEGHSEPRVSIGALKGFGMALRAAGLDNGVSDLESGDLILVECVGLTPTNKGNPMVDFIVTVVRPD